MSIDASRYVDFTGACPRCHQIIQTIDLTFQKGIFIYDLTFIQQELESVLVAAFQRQQRLVDFDHGETLKLPISSTISLINGKKARDFKAERERRRKAFNGQVTRRRRKRKKLSIPYERQASGASSISWKNSNGDTQTNGHQTRSYNEMSFRQTQHNGSPSKSSLIPDQFWKKILSQQQHEILSREDCQSIENFIHLDRSILKHFNDVNQYQRLIKQKEMMFSSKTYQHPELDESIVVKQNRQFHQKFQTISKKLAANFRRNRSNSIEINANIFDFLRREQQSFSSKYEELEFLINESISLESLALQRAEKQFQQDQIRVELMEIDEKVFEITNSIRQRKRPSENAVSFNKSISSNDQNGNHENEAWRKGRRQSTLRIYDELARLVDEHIELEKQLADIVQSDF